MKAHHHSLETEFQTGKMRTHPEHRPNAHEPHPGTTEHSADDHHHLMLNDLKKRFWIVLALTIPIMFLSPMIRQWLGMSMLSPNLMYVLFSLSTIVFIYGGWPFLKGWIAELKSWSPGMMTLIGFAITVAYLYSAATVFGLQGMDFFWELATLILIMLLGHWIEMRSVAGASRELALLVRLMPLEAHLLEKGNEHNVETEALKPGDLILVKPGEKIPADGIINSGSSYLNESMLTGESRPVEKNTGDKVIAGSLNGNGALQVIVSHGIKDSYLARVITLVEEARKAKSKTQLLADQAAQWLTLIALVAGISTFFYWWLNGQNLAFSIERMVTVIVICCPHALGLAVPLVVAKSTALSAQNGLLIKNRTAFEDSRKITTLVFDKTGTLTEGKFAVSNIVAISPELNDEEILKYAAALERSSEHPIATGIVELAKARQLNIPAAENFKAIPGKGIEATVGGKTVKVVSPGYLAEVRISIPSQFNGEESDTVAFVLINGALAGYIVLADKLRPESAEAIRVLKEHRIKAFLLTGDNAAVARNVSDTLKMDGYFAGVLPHQKLEKIKELQKKGEFVAMTGDGVNDAPALAQANIGIAVGSGSDIAAETAAIILVNSNPKDIVSLILFGKATYRKMIQNLAWATGYNIIALPLAAGVLFHRGILLSPAAGAILMSVSTLIVALNAGMLKIKSLHQQRSDKRHS